MMFLSLCMMQAFKIRRDTPKKSRNLHIVSNWVTYIDNVTLFVAMPEEYYGDYYSGATNDVVITIEGAQDKGDANAYAYTNFATVTLTTSSLNFHPDSTPPWQGSSGDFPPHGVYPADYWDVSLSNLLYHNGKGGYYDETVYDYDANFDPATSAQDIGDIQFYNVSWEPYSGDVLIHFDVI
jgi:hypothetical protein